MAVRVAHHGCCVAILQLHDSGRYETRAMILQGLDVPLQRVDLQRQMDVGEVVACSVDRRGSPGRRRAIVEQFDAGAIRCGGPQAGNLHHRIEGAVQSFLRGTAIDGGVGLGHPEDVSIERDAGRGIGDPDRGMVDTEKNAVAGLSVPDRAALTRRKIQKLQWMAVGIPEFKRRYRAVLRRKRLRAADGYRGERNSLQLAEGFAHVADYDRKVLKPEVLTVAVGRIATPQFVEFDELDLLGPHAHDQSLEARTFDAEQMREARVILPPAQDAFEAESFAVEALGSRQIGNRYADTLDFDDCSRCRKR